MPLNYALLGLLALLWGGSYPLIKLALDGFTPISLMAFRVTVAALILAGLAQVQGLTWPRGFRLWSQLLVQSFFNSIGAWTLLAWGQQHVPSGLAGVLNSTAPIFVTVWLLSVASDRRASWRPVAGAVLGLGGVAGIMGFGALEDLGTDLLAQGAILGGAMLYACAALYGRRFNALAPMITAAVTMGWAAVFLVPAAFVFEAPLALSPAPKALWAALALAVASTAGALVIYFRLIATLSPAGTASQAYLRAGVSVALGTLVLGEPLNPQLLAGVLAAIAGVMLINWPSQR
ncbi:MAG: DMT family transporter [Pseudomonadota bacterium]